MTLNLDRSTWTRVKFGEVARKVNAKVDPASGDVERYVAGEHMDTDELRISRWGTVGDGYLGPAFHARFRPGQVLYGSRRTYLRKVALADFDGVCANTTFVIETKDTSVLLPELLPFVMTTESFHAHSKAESKGSVNPYVNWPDIAKYEFDLPPLVEQKRIAELIWAVEGQRLALSALLSAVETVGSVLLGQLQAGSRQVKDVLTLARPGSTPSRSRSDYYGGATPWLKSGEVVGAAIETAQESITDAGLANSSAHVVPAGATVVAMYGEGETRGQVGRLAKPMATNQTVLALVADEAKCDPEFLYIWMTSRTGSLRNKSAGGVQKNLNKELVVTEPFPDASLDEQAAVVSQFRYLRSASGAVDAESKCLAALKDALLNELLPEVPHDVQRSQLRPGPGPRPCHHRRLGLHPWRRARPR